MSPLWSVASHANLTAMAEEVYFGKAKDVVGELRSKSLLLSCRTKEMDADKEYRPRTAFGNQ